MIKYSVPNELVSKLLELEIYETEEEAIEKVASGEALRLIIKEAEEKLETLKSNDAKGVLNARRSIEAYKRNQ